MIRKYSEKDKSALVNLFRLNTPQFFDPSEEKDFIHYLDYETEDYFVLEQNDQIIGCGGINYFPQQNTARLSWDMIHPDYKRQSLGKLLTEHRLKHIRKNSGIDRVVVRTTQLVYKFYERMGFQLQKVENDFWAKGFDLYQMELDVRILDVRCETRNEY